MTQTTTQTDQILSDTEIELLNDARSLLEMLAKRSTHRSWDAATNVGHDATSADYGSVRALADTTAHMIFETLNWTNASRIQPLTDDQIHNRANRNIAEVQS